MSCHKNFFLALFGLLVLKTGVYAETAPPVIKVACVGDSITWSPGEKDPASYPAHLAGLLGSGYEVRNFGVMARTALAHSDGVYTNTGAYSASKDYLPNIVLIMFGANDSKPQNWIHKDEFQVDVEQLIKSYQNLSNHPQVYLILPPPAFKNGYGISGEVIEKEELPLLKQAAAKAGAKIIDVFGAMQAHPELFDDGVHPGAQGRIVLAETVYSVINQSPPKGLEPVKSSP